MVLPPRIRVVSFIALSLVAIWALPAIWGIQYGTAALGTPSPGTLMPDRAETPAVPLRVGIVGLDTSHAEAFTKLLNGPKPSGDGKVGGAVAGAGGDMGGLEVVAAFPGGSPDIASSRDRVEGFTKQIQGDGRRDRRLHPRAAGKGGRGAAGERGRPAAPGAGAAGPGGGQAGLHRQAAGRLAGRRASPSTNWPAEHQTPWFSSSALRFCTDIPEMRHNPKVGDVTRLRRLEPLPAGADPPRPVLVRHPRRRTALHGHGPGLRVGEPDADRPAPRSRSASGRTAGSAPSAASRTARQDYGSIVFGTKGDRPQRRLRRLQGAGRPDRPVLQDRAGRRSATRRRWRSWRSWRRPTRASGRAGRR